VVGAATVRLFAARVGVRFMHRGCRWSGMAEEYVVSVASEKEPEEASALGVIGVIWYELSGGIGPWGALRPLVALAISLIPFLYLGQHFNRQHRKALGCFVIQLPLIFSVVLWPVLFIWSIADAWWVSSGIVAKAENE